MAAAAIEAAEEARRLATDILARIEVEKVKESPNEGIIAMGGARNSQLQHLRAISPAARSFPFKISPSITIGSWASNQRLKEADCISKLGDTLLSLGGVSIEDENYSQAEEGIGIMTRHKDEESAVVHKPSAAVHKPSAVEHQPSSICDNPVCNHHIKYSEGQTGQRHYGDRNYVDHLDCPAQSRALAFYNLDPEQQSINTQPRSGSYDNVAVPTGGMAPYSLITGFNVEDRTNTTFFPGLQDEDRSKKSRNLLPKIDSICEGHKVKKENSVSIICETETTGPDAGSSWT